MVKNIALAVLSVFLAASTVLAIVLAVEAHQTAVEARAAIQQANKTLYSYRGIAVDLRKAVTHNQELQRQLQAATFGTVETLNAGLAKSLDTINVRAGVTLDNVDGLVTDARVLVRNTDISLNDPDFGVLPAAAEAIRTVDGRVAVFFDNDLQGLTEATCTSIQQAGADVHAILGSPDIPIILQQVRLTMENGEQATCYVAQITHSGAELAQHYTDKLVRPSGWDRLKQILNIVLYGFGEIITPWAISARVHDVQVIP